MQEDKSFNNPDFWNKMVELLGEMAKAVIKEKYGK
tara:strand:- start:23 stop:127 length:105 start_codon:yes stop_codon:yes gene_type:complete